MNIRIRITVAILLSYSLAAFTITSTAQVRDLGMDAFLNQFTGNEHQSWFDPASNNFIRIDAYGRLNTVFNLGLPTLVDGRVTARDLGDGTEQVTVIGRSRNVLCWGSNLSTTPSTPMFGYSPNGVISGVGPASVGETLYRLVYTPQPVNQFDAFGEVEFWFGTATCKGQLRAGSGYAEGTPGFAQTTQTGLLSTGVPTGCPQEHDADCFPAEKIQFKAVGN